MELFATTTWYIWCQRNNMRVSEPVVLLRSVAGEAYQYLTTYQSGTKTRQTCKKEEHQMETPLARMYKTNFDGVMFEESDEVGIGVII